MALITFFVPQLLRLNLIPIFLFAITLVISNRFISYLINSFSILVFVYLLLSYRLEKSESIVFESRVRYQIVDLELDDFMRGLVENSFSNHRIFLVDTIHGIRRVYVDNESYKKLWPEAPFTMRDKNYTMKAKFEIRKLVFGGYSIAKVTDFKILNEKPMITK